MNIPFLGSSNRVPRSVGRVVPRPLRSRRSIFLAFHSIRVFRLRFLPRLSPVLYGDLRGLRVHPLAFVLYC